MESAKLRAMVAAAAKEFEGAELWPNGFGFEHGPFEYGYSESKNLWWSRNWDSDYIGLGSSPAEALSDAIVNHEPLAGELGLGRSAKG